MSQTLICTQGFKLIKQIGKGSFSNVWLAKCTSTGNHVAIKIISKDFVNKTERSCALIEKEVRIHKQLSHKNIASFLKIFDNEKNNFIVMEYVKGNTLLNVANSMRMHGFPLIESDIKKYFTQLLSALNYLHDDLHIVHRDLKLENVMIDVEDNAKIVDFGFSSFTDDHDELKESRGSLRYAAPEIFLKQESTPAVDMWALGVILYYCFTGFFPFDSKNSASELVSKILFGKVEYTDNMDHNVRSLIKGLLRKNPHKRMTCKEAMQHPWVTESTNGFDTTPDISEFNQILSTDCKNNNQSDNSSQDSQALKPQKCSEKKKNIKSCKSVGSINPDTSISSRVLTSSVKNKSIIENLDCKKETKGAKIRTSKSTFSDKTLRKTSNHNFSTSRKPCQSNSRITNRKKSINNYSTLSNMKASKKY